MIKIPSAAGEASDEIAEAIFSADLILSNVEENDLLKNAAESKILNIPTIHFGGFHPDVVYMRVKGQPSTPAFHLRNASASGLALAAYNKGLGQNDAISLYSASSYEALGFFDYFDLACSALFESIRGAKLPTVLFEQHIVTRDLFMFGPLHPKQRIINSLVYSILAELNLESAISQASLNQILPDSKEFEYSWSCFPPIANRLGIKGGWGVRLQNTYFLEIKHYVASLYNFLEAHPTGIELSPADSNRFNVLHKIDSVLNGIKNESV